MCIHARDNGSSLYCSEYLPHVGQGVSVPHEESIKSSEVSNDSVLSWLARLLHTEHRTPPWIRGWLENSGFQHFLQVCTDSLHLHLGHVGGFPIHGITVPGVCQSYCRLGSRGGLEEATIRDFFSDDVLILLLKMRALRAPCAGSPSKTHIRERRRSLAESAPARRLAVLHLVRVAQ